MTDRETLSDLFRRPTSAIPLVLAAASLLWAVVFSAWTAAQSQNAMVGLALSLPDVLQFGLLGLGLYIVARGVPRRVGRSLHCAKCGYERVEERDRLLINCPECGHHWRLFGGWRVGRPAGSRSTVIKGSALVVLSLAGLSLRSVMAEWIASRLPTNLLVRHILFAPPSTTGPSWAALRGRALAEPQVRWLAEGFLDRRRTSPLDLASAQWLDARLTDATVTGDLRARYFDELCDFQLEADASALVGAETVVQLRGVYRGPPSGTPDGPVVLAVGGIQIDLPAPPDAPDRTEFEKRSLVQPLSETQARGQRLVPATRLYTTPGLALAGVRSDNPGTAVVRASVWVLVGPGLDGPVSWGDDGSPRLGFGAAHVLRIELEKHITIQPLRP